MRKARHRRIESSINCVLCNVHAINDVVEHCNSVSDIFLFADDAKDFFSSCIKTDEDSKQLQQDLDKFKEWIDTWLLSLNVGKCKTVSYGRKLIFSTNI